MSSDSSDVSSLTSPQPSDDAPRSQAVRLLVHQPDLIPGYAMDTAASFTSLTKSMAAGDISPTVAYTRAVTLRGTIDRATRVLTDVMHEASDPVVREETRHRLHIVGDLLDTCDRFIESTKKTIDADRVSTSIAAFDHTMKKPNDYTDADLYVTRASVTTRDDDPFDSLYGQTFTRRTYTYVERTIRDTSSSRTITRLSKHPSDSDKGPVAELHDDLAAGTHTLFATHPVLFTVLSIAVMLLVSFVVTGIEEDMGVPTILRWMTSLLVGLASPFVVSRITTRGRDVKERRNWDDEDQPLPLGHRRIYREDVLRDLLDTTTWRMNLPQQERLDLTRNFNKGLEALAMSPAKRQTLREKAARTDDPREHFRLWDEHLVCATRAWLIELLELVEVVMPDHAGAQPPAKLPEIDDELHAAFALLVERYQALLIDPEKEQAFEDERIKQANIARREEEKRSSAIEKVLSRYGDTDNDTDVNTGTDDTYERTD